MTDTSPDRMVAWRAAAEKALRGKPLDSLTWHTEDGFDLPPQVTAGDVVGLPHLDAPRRGGGGFLSVAEYWPVTYRDTFEAMDELFEQGYDRIQVDAEVVDLTDPAPLDRLLVAFDDLEDDRADVERLLARDDGVPAVFGTSLDGASAAQHVADSLADLTRRLRSHDPERLVPRTVLAVPVGTDVLTEIAKLRALRLLADKVTHHFGVDDRVALLAEQSLYHDTRFEPHTNLLRATLAGVAAVVAGVELIQLTSYDSFESDPPSDASRLAMNQLRLLTEESFLDRVVDPTAGAHAVEALTHGIASTAWGYLQALESAGHTRPDDPDPAGALEVLGIDETEARRLADIRTRRRVIVGINRFADPDLDTEAGPSPHAEIYVCREDERIDDAVFPIRASLPFEWLRDRVLWFQEDHGGRRPGLQALRFGPRGLARARAEFAADFFRAGGFRVEEPLDVADVAEAVVAADDCDASVFVLCGPDPDYLTFAPEFVAGLRSSGSDALVYAAGPPPGDGEDLALTGFVHRGADCWELLCHALDELRLPRLPRWDDEGDDDEEPDA